MIFMRAMVEGIRKANKVKRRLSEISFQRSVKFKDCWKKFGGGSSKSRGCMRNRQSAKRAKAAVKTVSSKSSLARSSGGHIGHSRVLIQALFAGRTHHIPRMKCHGELSSLEYSKAIAPIGWTSVT